METAPLMEETWPAHACYNLIDCLGSSMTFLSVLFPHTG